MDSSTDSQASAAGRIDNAILSLYLEWDVHLVHNPHTNLSLDATDPAWEALQALRSGMPATALDAITLARLTRDGWLVDRDDDQSRRYRLRIVSLETSTPCNQKCYFCPVSIAPREDVRMPQELFDRILADLCGYRESLEGVFLQSYNEPTTDRRFVSHCHQLFDAGLPVAVLTNGSGLTPKRTDEILARGRLRFLAVNLSTLDRERYAADRGADHLERVLENVDYLARNPIATEMRIVVLGQDDATHEADFESIRDRYAGTPFEVTRHTVMDRAGYLEVGLKPAVPHRRLRGCDNIGSRPIQHLHVTPAGLCVLCCEDYDEAYIVGDLATQTIHEVMSGSELARLRRWTYGLEESPDDYICRNCVFAKTSEA